MTDYSLVFDGGSRGNPGLGYGSFRVRVGDGPWLEAVRLEFGDHVTNNEAEYQSLIAAFEAVERICGDPDSITVTVYGDSQLVLNQVRGTWKVRAANLRPLFERARSSAVGFRAVRYVWHRRDESVRLLGH